MSQSGLISDWLRRRTDGWAFQVGALRCMGYPRVRVTELVFAVHRADGNESAKMQPEGELSFNSSPAPRWFASCLLMAKPMPLPPSFFDWQGMNTFRPSGK